MPFYHSGETRGQSRGRGDDPAKQAQRPWGHSQDQGQRRPRPAASSPDGAGERQRDLDDMDLIDQEPVPLEEAAARLELSTEALLAAFRAGDFRGFVDEGTLFVYVPEELAEEQQEPATEDPASKDGVVAEFQRLEINRLLEANRELQDEKDKLFRLLEREQVLRQGIQRTLDRAWSNLLPPAEERGGVDEVIQTIDRYGKDPEKDQRKGTEDDPLDIGSFLGRHD